MTVEAIKEAIARLADEERHSLSIWLNGLEYDDWDKQMATDFSPGGRGARLVETVKANVATGFDLLKSFAATRNRRASDLPLPRLA